MIPVSFDLFNLNAPSGFTAALDLDSVASSGNTSAFTTDLAPFSNLSAGASQEFTSSFNVAAVGTFMATYTLTLSDENLSGATNKTLTLTLKGVARLAGDVNNDGTVDGGDYVVWQRSLGQSVAAAYDGADGDGNLMIDNADFDVWRAHYGQTAPGSGSASRLAAVLEPAMMWLIVSRMRATVCGRPDNFANVPRSGFVSVLNNGPLTRENQSGGRRLAIRTWRRSEAGIFGPAFYFGSQHFETRALTRQTPPADTNCCCADFNPSKRRHDAVTWLSKAG